MLKHSVVTENTLNFINNLKNEISLISCYFDDNAMHNLLKEAISYYEYAGWNKSLFIDNQVHYLKYHVKRTEAESIAPKFFTLVEILRKESGMFLF